VSGSLGAGGGWGGGGGGVWGGGGGGCSNPSARTYRTHVAGTVRELVDTKQTLAFFSML